jgi:hypothetical protein
MGAKEVFVNYYNFNPIWVQHASIHVKKYWDSSQKVNLYYSEPGDGAGCRSQSRKKYLRLCGAEVGAGAERNIFGYATMLWM